MNYINHFGEKSSDYLAFRPDYPDELFRYLASLVPTHDLAWDCGTGNGQAAVKLTHYFDKVIATDINQAQLVIAVKHEKINYECAPAEKTTIRNASVDLITIAQALHWFNLEAFYTEVKRVAKKEGIIAAWSYSLGKITPELDSFIHILYEEILGDAYWPKERKYIDAGYATIPFPFLKMPTPSFAIEKKIHFSQLLGYLNTWSAVKEYEKRVGKNPVAQVADKLELAWGDKNEERVMRWPLHLLVGKMIS